MRNELGPVAHGRDGFLDSVTADHARAFVHTGDALLSILLNALEGKEPELSRTREPYERFAHLNERIDRAVGVEARVDDDGDRPMLVLAVATGPREEAIEIRVEPSRLLYGVDRLAYIEVLRNLDAVVAAGERAEEPVAEAVQPIGVAKAPAPEVVPRYGGRLAPFRPALAEFLGAEGWRAAEATIPGGDLLDSLLATADDNMGLDWKRRDTLQARLKIACKRVLVRFGSDPDDADRLAERVVAWMRIQIPDSGQA